MQNIAPTIGKGIDAKIPPNFPVGKKTKGSNKDQWCLKIKPHLVSVFFTYKKKENHITKARFHHEHYTCQ